jgi:DNA repair protein RadC
MSIRDWPAAERPREKLLERGAGSLSDAELLAIFLRTGVSGKSAVDLARHLLNRFGSLRALLDANLAAFSGELGLGPAKFAQLQAVMEMARRHMGENLRRGSVLTSPAKVRSYLKALLRHEPHEVFGCLFLDSKNRVQAFEALFQGSINMAHVHARQVVKRALAHNSAGVILCRSEFIRDWPAHPTHLHRLDDCSRMNSLLQGDFRAITSPSLSKSPAVRTG